MQRKRIFLGLTTRPKVTVMTRETKMRRRRMTKGFGGGVVIPRLQGSDSEASPPEVQLSTIFALSTPLVRRHVSF